MPLVRQKNMARVLEYQCQAEAEEKAGLFERDARTWFPQNGQASPESKASLPPGGTPPALKVGAKYSRACRGSTARTSLTGLYNPELVAAALTMDTGTPRPRLSHAADCKVWVV